MRQTITCKGPGCDVEFEPSHQYHSDSCRAKAHKLEQKKKKPKTRKTA